jgi:uncharacterized protein DUF6908
MKTVEKIIEAFGGLEFLNKDYIRLDNEPYMTLCIEYIGPGPRGLPQISVAHYGQQNGDAMRDPDIVFEVDFETGMGWGPVSFRNDYAGVFQEAVWVAENGDVMIRPALVKELKQFARIWDRNLKEQGFLERALALVSKK